MPIVSDRKSKYLYYHHQSICRGERFIHIIVENSHSIFKNGEKGAMTCLQSYSFILGQTLDCLNNNSTSLKTFFTIREQLISKLKNICPFKFLSTHYKNLKNSFINYLYFIHNFSKINYIGLIFIIGLLFSLWFVVLLQHYMQFRRCLKTMAE